MNPEDWDRAPRNTNGIERANYSAKSGGHKLSLYAAMQSLNEKDKMFALQYITVEDGSKITYLSSVDEEQRSQAAMRRRKQKDICDKNASYGPPDKHQHFEDTDFEEIRPRNKRRKMDKDRLSDEDNEDNEGIQNTTQ